MGTIGPDLDVSVIIPVAPGADPAAALEAVRRSIPRGVSAEVLTVTGTHPSRQRNLAANRARGRVLWFLDHDAIPAPATLGRLLAAMRRFDSAIAGGPNLPTDPRSAFEAIFGGVIASPVGSPFVSARYGGRASTGPAGERDLILCNLLIDREAFLAAGGFDPRLYPNEENALLNQMARRGFAAVYAHDAPVCKPRPSSFRSFLVESFRYGQGRMQQIWVAPAFGDAIFVAALLFAVICVLASLSRPWLPGIYALLIFLESARVILTGESWETSGRAWAREGTGLSGSRARIAAYLVAFVCRHAAYGLGMCWGLMAGWRRRRLRWRPMQATLRRYAAGPVAMRLVETVSCRIGSIAREAGPDA
jgi:GT2 family glycosyltransferase